MSGASCARERATFNTVAIERLMGMVLIAIATKIGAHRHRRILPYLSIGGYQRAPAVVRIVILISPRPAHTALLLVGIALAAAACAVGAGRALHVRAVSVRLPE